MLYELLRQTLETKLNTNTLNKKFVVGSYAYLEDKDKHYVYNVKVGYKLIEKEYIPAMLRFTADYDALPGQINGRATMGLEFLIKSDYQENLDSDLGVLEELVSKIVANYETLTDGAKSYYTVWNMDALLPSGVTPPINGDYYTRITTTIYVEFSDTNIFGNAYRYYLDNKLLTLYDGDVSRVNEENYPHKQGDYEAKGGNTTSQWHATLITYIDANVQAICDSISSDTYNMEQGFTYAEYFNGTLKHEFSVKITSMTRKIVLGEKQYMSFSLIKSDELILAP